MVVQGVAFHWDGMPPRPLAPQMKNAKRKRTATKGAAPRVADVGAAHEAGPPPSESLVPEALPTRERIDRENDLA